MTDRPGPQQLLVDTLARAAAQFGTLAIAFLLAPVLIRAFGEPFPLAVANAVVSRAEREGLIATARGLIAGRSVATR